MANIIDNPTPAAMKTENTVSSKIVDTVRTVPTRAREWIRARLGRKEPGQGRQILNEVAQANPVIDWDVDVPSTLTQPPVQIDHQIVDEKLETHDNVGKRPTIFEDKDIQAEALPTDLPTFEASLDQVLSLVLPVGACHELNNIRINNQPISEVVIQPQLPQSSEMVNQIDINVSIIKPILQKLLTNNQIMRLVAIYQGSRIPIHVVAQELNIAELDTKNRLDLILNTNMDPQLLPMAINAMQSELTIPDSIVSLLSTNPSTINEFVTLLGSKKFQEQFFAVYPGNYYSPQMEDDILGLIGSITNNLQLESDQTGSINEWVKNFFNLEAKHYGKNSPCARLIEKLQRITSIVYFEKKIPESDGTETWTDMAYCSNIPIWQEMRAHALAGEMGKYLLDLCEVSQQFYQQYFPEMFRPVEFTHMELRISENLHAGGYVDTGAFGMEIHNNVAITDPEFKNQKVLVRGDLATRCMIRDQIIGNHELSHVYFPDIGTKPENYRQTLECAINEGIAVLMELLTVDTLLSSPEKFRLTDIDIQDLKAYKLGIIDALEPVYKEGYSLISKLFNQSAHEGGVYDQHKGLKRVREIVDHLDTQKCLALTIDSQEFNKLREENDPNLIEKTITLPKNTTS